MCVCYISCVKHVWHLLLLLSCCSFFFFLQKNENVSKYDRLKKKELSSTTGSVVLLRRTRYTMHQSRTAAVAAATLIYQSIYRTKNYLFVVNCFVKLSAVLGNIPAEKLPLDFTETGIFFRSRANIVPMVPPKQPRKNIDFTFPPNCSP